MLVQNDRKINRSQVEAISRANARSLIKGTDHLKSSGRMGKVFLPNLQKVMKYRSLLEKVIMQAIDRTHDVVALEGEAFFIPYYWKGVTLSYVPDLLVKLRNGKVWILEVKPASQIEAPKNAAKFAAAREFCRVRGDHLRFGVLTGANGVKELLSSHGGIGMLEQKIKNRANG